MRTNNPADTPIAAPAAMAPDDLYALKSFFHDNSANLRLDSIQEAAYYIAASKGFHSPRDIGGITRDASFGERIALIHEETTEALMAHRQGANLYLEVDGKPEGILPELADIVIRVLDLAEKLRRARNDEDARQPLPTLAAVIQAKMAYNNTRPQGHGKKNGL